MEVSVNKYDVRQAHELVFGYQESLVYGGLDSLEGVVELGVGKDRREAKEDYMQKLDYLIKELQSKRNSLMDNEAQMTYVSFKEV